MGGRVSDCQHWQVRRFIRAEGAYRFEPHQRLGELQRERYLSGCDLKRLANRGAYYLGEINAVHPFREGNGRTQREFIRQLAIRNGYELDWSRVTREQMIEASKQSFRRDDLGLEHVLTSALDNEHNRHRERDSGGWER